MSHDARFSIIPGWIVTDSRLKGRDLQVLCVLGRHTNKQGWCRRSQVKMAAEMSCARSTVQASIDRLADIGVVEKHVEESEDGRDSAHFYRVIFDRMPPAGYAFDAYQGGEDEENNPISGTETGTPPADISAPPADPESAPPAGPGSAPINVPSLTPPTERTEKSAGMRAEGSMEDRRSLERSYMRLIKAWPNIDGLPKDGWFSAWADLTDAERAEAERRFPDWLKVLDKGGKGGKHTPRPSTYFRSKLWAELPEDAAQPASVEAVPATGKGGMAYRLWIMNQPERQHPVPPPAVQMDFDAGGDRMADAIIKRRGLYSWPRLVDINDKLLSHKPVRVPPEIAALGSDFVSTELAGPVGEAWKRLFRRMHMPWLPGMPGQPHWPKYAYLPPLGGEDDLDKAVAAAWWQFAERCKGHADAA
jgi:hypothetical protein